MKSSILLPLYIYPNLGVWDPLYAAIAAFPDLQWIIIVNPSSGPGSMPWWPNEDYVREIPRLNAQPNVTTVGYVKADYCRRAVEDISQDVDTYAIRATDRNYPGLEMNGIFVDETPNLYSNTTKAHLDAIDQKVKGCPGIQSDRIVIHNPGTAVNKGLADPGPDITTVVETSYAEFVTPNFQQWLATSPYDRSRSSYMVHSVPDGEVANLTIALRERAQYLFVTSLTENFYESFGPSWGEFVAAMAEP
ncbi:hypothetical protein P153DRAFT_396608 [Dothidotthia symphoricarpi CBS 119687]|uniref:Cell surface protein n=1 Tax=Dothidotthia symphoricarpi CBS 119687 TaxID=1392245 RepID=A0A6A6AE04_9PLEO|nr:uncharacterized protein P153DRAFT_396608 [Dothidotthia symphoricarpi CBS 119687]KAF2129325.1 hypothetical protein P153DRAFT_396608 [Dothidotthia symphoricarpi CBS 119687]